MAASRARTRKKIQRLTTLYVFRDDQVEQTEFDASRAIETGVEKSEESVGTPGFHASLPADRQESH